MDTLCRFHGLGKTEIVRSFFFHRLLFSDTSWEEVVCIAAFDVSVKVESRPGRIISVFTR